MARLSTQNLAICCGRAADKLYYKAQVSRDEPDRVPSEQYDAARIALTHLQMEIQELQSQEDNE